MHDSGDDVHLLPSYEKSSDSRADPRPGAITGIADPSVKNKPSVDETVLLEVENPCEPEAHVASKSEYVLFVKNLALSKCSKCGKYAIWVRDRLVYPVIE